MSSLFHDKIESRCAYCAHARSLNQTQVICPKKGVMDALSHCRKFKYDPLRRTPPRPQPAKFSDLKAEDFAL